MTCEYNTRAEARMFHQVTFNFKEKSHQFDKRVFIITCSFYSTILKDEN